MDFENLKKAKLEIEKHGNIVAFLKKIDNQSENSSKIIEISYDLQAGSYIGYANSHCETIANYSAEISTILDENIVNSDIVLDVGAGELTTLSLVLEQLINKPERVIAFDLSWSRLFLGLEFMQSRDVPKEINFSTFVADMKCIPLCSNSVDVVTSSHALEPNGGSLQKILSELFRIARRKLILFEPSYEFNSLEGKQRMEYHGYIKDLSSEVTALGGKLIECIQIDNAINSLNPTFCYIIEPPEINFENESSGSLFSVPGTSYPLTHEDGFFMSENLGVSFPILRDIPLLKPENAILSNALFN